MDYKHEKSYEVCLCKHVTRGEVEDFIRRNRVTDLKVLCAQMNIGNKCGGCREDLEMILQETNAAI